jgi:hypothetical protein
MLQASSVVRNVKRKHSFKSKKKKPRNKNSQFKNCAYKEEKYYTETEVLAVI